MKNNTIFFLQKDFKYKGWANELNKLKNLSTIVNKGYYSLSFLVLWKSFFLKKYRVKAVVIRYLNDRKSFVNSLGNMISDYLIVFSCLMTGTKILWIKHNVDRETFIYYPWINKRRVALFEKFSHKIFITDLLLIKYLKEDLHYKVDWISFGVFDNHNINDTRNTEIHNHVLEFLKKGKEEEFYTGLTITSGFEKFYHFKEFLPFVEKFNTKHKNKKIRMVIIGSFPPSDFYEEIKKQIISSEYFLFIQNKERIEVERYEQIIDFIYRSVDDKSVSFSLYDAIKLKKPVITGKRGFVSEFVDYYEVGFSIKDFHQEFHHELDTFLQNWTGNKSEEFLKKYNWKAGAYQLYKEIL